VVFLNFYATWCPPCNKELPDIQKLYQEYGLNKDDVVFLGITNPKSKDYPNNSDEDIDYIKSFLIDKKGNVLGYVPGMMTEDIMKNVIGQALDTAD
jgi:cytochrome c-type biogenesis protein